jgi:DNA-binding CsgD family transcriptional regulator
MPPNKTYSLTPSERKLALRLAAGLSLRDAGLELNITYETARSTLRSIFQKTNTHRQAELIILLLSKTRVVLMAAFIALALFSNACEADDLHSSKLATSQESCLGATLNDKPTWKKIAIGNFKNFFDLRHALHQAEISVGDKADEILARPSFKTSKSRIEFDLTVSSAKDLGIQDQWASQSQIYARARCFGLELCNTEIAPQLRLDYRDQPLGEVLIVAMEARKTYDGELINLSLAHFPSGAKGRGLMLLGGDGRPEAKIRYTMPFVFVRSSSIAQAKR